MKKTITDSRFYMWRTLFAVAHADNVVTDEEIEFMAHVLEDVSFTEEQTDTLKDDIANAKNVEFMFDGVTDINDRIEFFDLARDLVWVDGDFGSQEQSVMIKLQQKHIERADVDQLIQANSSLELEDDPSVDNRNEHQKDEGKEGKSFYKAFSCLYKKFSGK